MVTNHFNQPYKESKGNYTLKVKGYVPADWTDKFAGLEISHEVEDDNDISVLKAYIRDDAEYKGFIHALKQSNHDVISIKHD